MSITQFWLQNQSNPKGNSSCQPEAGPRGTRKQPRGELGLVHLQSREGFGEAAEVPQSWNSLLLPLYRNSSKFLTFRHSIISPFISLSFRGGFRCAKGYWAQRLMIFLGWLLFTGVNDLLLHFLHFMGHNWNNSRLSEYDMSFLHVAKSELIQRWMKRVLECYTFLILSRLFIPFAPVQSENKMTVNKNSPTIIAFYPGQADCTTHQWPWPMSTVVLTAGLHSHRKDLHTMNKVVLVVSLQERWHPVMLKSDSLEPLC